MVLLEGLLDRLAGPYDDLGQIEPAHLRDVVKRADMERWPTPPAGVKSVRLILEERRRFGRPHLWRDK